MKLSIITINRNNANGLRKTIESVVNQICIDYEYIVIDGGSTDESVDIIRAYSDKIHYWVSEPDKGIYNAMNKGIAQAHGDYCLFLNSGDWLYSDSIISYFNKSAFSEDVIFGDLIIVDGTKVIREKKHHQFVVYDLMTNSLPHQASFIKRQLFDQFGLYDESFRIISDWKFYVDTIILGNATVRQIPYFISYFDCNGIGSTYDDLDKEERTIVLSSKFDLDTLSDYESTKLLDVTQFFCITKCIINLLSALVLFDFTQKKEVLKTNLPTLIARDYIYFFKVQRILSIPYYRSLYYLVRKIAMNRIKRKEISIYY